MILNNKINVLLIVILTFTILSASAQTKDLT